MLIVGKWNFYILIPSKKSISYMFNKYLLTLLLIPLLYLPSNASHLMGNDLRIVCVNNCTTRVELRLYRDCTGSNFISPTPVQFTPTSGCGQPISLTGWSVQLTTEVTPICPTVPTNCTTPGATFNGVQEFYWEREYDMCNLVGCTYDISYSTCCRNTIITSGAANNSIYFENSYTVGATCNNSPEFLNTPLFYACAGQLAAINMGAFDADGDSLTYALASCYNNNSTSPVTYAAGYSPTAPFGPSWNVTLHPTTGVMTMDPQPGNIMVGVVCVETNEYRNGQLIGTSVRDIQVSTIACPSQNVPIVSAPYNLSPGGTVVNNNTVSFCSGSNVCFDINIVEPDSAMGQSATIWWDQSWAGATFTEVGNPSNMDTLSGTYINGRFCLPNPAPGNYAVVFSLRDNSCPVFSYVDFVYNIQITATTSNFVTASSTTIDTCGSDTVTLDASALTGTYAWSNGMTTSSIDVYQPGTYTVTVTSSTGCGGVDSVEVLPTAIPQITGQVSTPSPGLLAFSPVYLVWHDPSTQSLFALDTVTTDANGNYAFCKFPEDTLYVKAAPQLPTYPNFLPTYSDTAVFWNNAEAWLKGGAPHVVDFEVRSGTNPGGPGFIGGLISQGANKTSGVGDPVPDVTVFIREQSSGDYYGYTTTDNDGYFSFSNLPLGQYEIAVDDPGVDEDNVPSLNLTSQAPSVDSLDFRLHSTYLELFVPTSVISAAGVVAVQIMPNPSNESAYMLLELPAEMPVSVEIWDVQGKQLAQVLRETVGTGRHLYALPELGAGIYFVKANVGGEMIVRRMVRK